MPDARATVDELGLALRPSGRRRWPVLPWLTSSAAQGLRRHDSNWLGARVSETDMGTCLVLPTSSPLTPSRGVASAARPKLVEGSYCASACAAESRERSALAALEAVFNARESC